MMTAAIRPKAPAIGNPKRIVMQVAISMYATSIAELT
jgi:hypothetical protein